MSSLLNRDNILQAQDLAHEDVFVPAWNGTVRVRALTGAERDAFEASIVEQRGKNARVRMENMRAKLVAMTVVDESGERLFSDADATALGKKSAQALTLLFEVASRLSGMSSTELEEIEKN